MTAQAQDTGTAGKQTRRSDAGILQITQRDIDGFVLCAAPLAEWFPRNTWRQVTDELSAVRQGDYPWASVHKFRDAL